MCFAALVLIALTALAAAATTVSTDTTGSRFTVSVVTSTPFTTLSVTSQEVLSASLLSTVASALYAGSSYEYMGKLAAETAVLSLFPMITLTSTSSNSSSSSVSFPLCSKLTATGCVVPGIRYNITVSLMDGDGVALESVSLTTSPVDQLYSPPRGLAATTGEGSIQVSWIHPDTAINPNNTVLQYAVAVYFDAEGNAPDLGTYANTTADMPNQLLVNITLGATATSASISGCYAMTLGSTHCIYPWTVYQITVTAVGTLRDDQAQVFAVTQEGPQRVVAGSSDIAPVTNPTSFIIRTYIPRPWAGAPLNYSVYWTGQFNQSGSFNAPITTSATAHVESLSFGVCTNLHTLRIFNVIPYSVITAYFAPINAAGIAVN